MGLNSAALEEHTEGIWWTGRTAHWSTGGADKSDGCQRDMQGMESFCVTLWCTNAVDPLTVLLMPLCLQCEVSLVIFLTYRLVFLVLQFILPACCSPLCNFLLLCLPPSFQVFPVPLITVVFCIHSCSVFHSWSMHWSGRVVLVGFFCLLRVRHSLSNLPDQKYALKGFDSIFFFWFSHHFI